MKESTRILIITSGPLCRNPRVLKEATTLGHAGYDVTVLGVAQLERYEIFDREIMRTAPFRKLTYDLADRTPIGRASSFISRLKTSLARRAARWGLELPAAFGPYSAMLRIAEKTPADLIIGHTEVALLICHHLMKRGRHVAVDFEDWHSHDLLPEARMSRPLRLLARIERELMRGAVYTSTTSQALAVALQNESGGRPPIVVDNSFPLQSAPDSDGKSSENIPAFFWFSQTIGPGRGLEYFLAAWSQTRHPSRLCLLGDIDSDYSGQLLTSLPESHRSRVMFLPITSPDTLPSVIARHDIGLALETDTPPSRNLTITNKILQYLNSGLAVIASNTVGQREVLTRAPNVGLLVDLAATEELSRTLDHLLADPKQISKMGRAARRAAEEHYCWEKSSILLLSAVRAALEKSPEHV